jgi:hypothetical protein
VFEVLGLFGRICMNGRKMVVMVLLGVSMAWLGLGVQWAIAQDAIAKITKEELNGKLDDPDVVIVDVRLGKDWKASESKIKGALRVEPGNVLSLTDKYPKDKMLVFYCA